MNLLKSPSKWPGWLILPVDRGADNQGINRGVMNREMSSAHLSQSVHSQLEWFWGLITELFGDVGHGLFQRRIRLQGFLDFREGVHHGGVVLVELFADLRQ